MLPYDEVEWTHFRANHNRLFMLVIIQSIGSNNQQDSFSSTDLIFAVLRKHNCDGPKEFVT